MNNLQIFNNNEFGEIRTAKVDGKPYLMLADVCRVLEIKNVSDVKSRLNDKGVVTTDTLTNGGIQQATFINESNFYKVVFQSRKPQAEKFTEWVTSEVLPSIRETGMYSSSNNILERFHQFNGLVIDELNGVNARIDKLEDETIVNSRQVKKIKDKANAKAMQVLGGKDSICYQDSSIRAVVYANLWNDYKDYLGITSYSDTRKIDYDKGIDFISKWQPNGRTMRILEGVIEYV